jgi:hypothetical protein
MDCPVRIRKEKKLKLISTHIRMSHAGLISSKIHQVEIKGILNN